MKKYGLLFLVILEASASFVLQGAERERRISIKAKGEESITLSEAEFKKLKEASETIRNMFELLGYVGEGLDNVRIPLPDVAPETVRLLLAVLASPSKMTKLKMDQLIPLIELYHFLKLDHKDLVDKEASLTDLFKQIGTQYKLDMPPDSPGRLPDDLERLFLQFYLRNTIERTLQFNGSVNSVALSGDGTIAMAGSRDSKAQIYDVGSGALLRTLRFNGPVYSVALSADGKVATMAGSTDNTAKIYDVRTGRLLHTLTLKFGSFVRSVALSADGTVAMAGSTDSTAKIYDVRTSELLHTLEFSGGGVNSVALSADGKIAMVGSGNGKAQIYDVRSGALLHTLRFTRSVFSVALSQDGTIALAGSTDGTARIYDVRTERLLHTLRFNDSVYSVALSQDGTIAMAGSADGTAQIYDVRTERLLHTLRLNDSVYSVALSQDGTIAMAGSFDNTAKIVIVIDDLAALRGIYSRMIAARTVQAGAGTR